MKKKFIALFMVGLSISNLYGCNKKEQNVNENKQNYEIVNEEKKEDSNNIKPETEDLMQNNVSGEVTSAETKKVGRENYGFVEVPDNWVNFKDVDLPSDTSVIQYSDPSGSLIITMNISENYEQDAKIAAENSFQNMKNDGVDVVGAKVNIGAYEAYQVYGIYENEGITLVSWHFKDENNTLHYVSAEGKLNDIINVVGYVEKTYSLS
ncbi:MAG: hypothetical protein E7208_08670 [Clostridium butyricum]|nr:hypothetical protein [Clostridium butyricum]